MSLLWLYYLILKIFFTFFSFLLIKLIIPAAPNKANIRPAIANHLLFFSPVCGKESGAFATCFVLRDSECVNACAFGCSFCLEKDNCWRPGVLSAEAALTTNGRTTKYLVDYNWIIDGSRYDQFQEQKTEK